jgi:hypothetical protein
VRDYEQRLGVSDATIRVAVGSLFLDRTPASRIGISLCSVL